MSAEDLMSAIAGTYKAPTPLPAAQRMEAYNPASYQQPTGRFTAQPAAAPVTGGTTPAVTGPVAPSGQAYTGLAASYFAANPDVQRAFETEVKGMTPDEYARFHWERFGFLEGRSGYPA